jgi:flagellar L-ring protein precursor FlgH
MKRALSAWVAAVMLAGASSASAADIPSNTGFSALGSDRVARAAGDSITIVIYENATASNDASSGSKKNSQVSGSLRASSAVNEDAALGLGGSSSNQGSTGRSGHMVAQISAVVEEILPNGDLRVGGEQMLNINGERTLIRIKGRIRPADISSANAVLSSRLAEAKIDYDGSGFVSRSARPGIVSRIFNWLGLL